MVTRKKMTALAAFGGLIACASDARSAAFMLQEQSVKASGRAFAGEAAVAEDASTIFYNPAGMTELKQAEALIGTYVMFPRAEISNAGTNVSGTAITGSNDQGFSPTPFGHLYLAAPISQGLWGGIGVTVPFGLANKYDSDFFGRYDSTEASIRVIDIAPSLAYALMPQVSIGGGVNFQYASTKLVNALPNPFDPSGAPTPATDGSLKVEGTDWSVGYNLGLLVKPTSDLKVGLTYRSAITHKVEGDSTQTIFGSTTVQDVSSEIDLPDTISLGVAYTVNPSLTLLGQVNRYGWSRFKEIRLKFANGTEAATTEEFRDTWSVSIGAQYQLTSNWVIRGGMMYDQTPTRDAYRSVVIPDPDRFWASIGASYNFSNTIALDISYEHLFENEAPINRTNSFPALGTTVQTRGTTETSSDVLGVALRMQF